MSPRLRGTKIDDPPEDQAITPEDLAGGDWMPIMFALDKLEREHGVVRSRASIIRAIKVGDLRGGRFGWGGKTAHIVRYSDVIAYLLAHPARSTMNLAPNGVEIERYPRRQKPITETTEWAQRERARNYRYAAEKRQREREAERMEAEPEMVAAEA